MNAIDAISSGNYWWSRKQCKVCWLIATPRVFGTMPLNLIKNHTPDQGAIHYWNVVFQYYSNPFSALQSSNKCLIAFEWQVLNIHWKRVCTEESLSVRFSSNFPLLPISLIFYCLYCSYALSITSKAATHNHRRIKLVSSRPLSR